MRGERSPIPVPRPLTTFALAAIVALTGLAGCLGSDDVPGTDRLGTDAGEPISALGEPFTPTPATQALRDAGFADPYLNVEPTGVVHEYDFWVDDQFVLAPHEGREIWGFAFTTDPDEPGTVPAPEIRVTQGDTVRVNLHNRGSLINGHTMHWHGVDLPWGSDGVPALTQPAEGIEGESAFTYEFVAKQPGTYWYHCVMEFPAHVDGGMFGMLIVEPQDPSEDLPFDREETLIFHEADSQVFAAAGWAFNDNMDPDPEHLSTNPVDLADSAKSQTRSAIDVAGSVTGPATGEYLFSEGPRDYFPVWTPRYTPIYDTFMINGKSYPNTDPVYIDEGETLRLRLLNAGQNHKSIHLHGHHMLVTHNDGYPLPTPHWEDTINLAPGERIDAYVQGTNPGIWSLHDHSGVPGSGTTVANDYAFPGGMETMLVYEDFEPPGRGEQPEGDVTAGDLAVYAPSYQNR